MIRPTPVSLLLVFLVIAGLLAGVLVAGGTGGWPLLLGLLVAGVGAMSCLLMMSRGAIESAVDQEIDHARRSRRTGGSSPSS